jgi:hypothetical protein
MAWNLKLRRQACNKKLLKCRKLNIAKGKDK